MYPPVTVYTSNHPGDIDSLSLKAQIGIYKCLETTRILPDVQSADGIEYRSYEVETVRVSEPGSLDADDFLSKLKYESYEAERNRLIRKNLDSSCKITVNFWYSLDLQIVWAKVSKSNRGVFKSNRDIKRFGDGLCFPIAHPLFVSNS